VTFLNFFVPECGQRDTFSAPPLRSQRLCVESFAFAFAFVTEGNYPLFFTAV